VDHHACGLAMTSTEERLVEDNVLDNNMTLDYIIHKHILMQMLKDVYTDTSIAPHLGFKGGTAAMLFYELPRNSVDLDFDLLDESKNYEVFKKMTTIVSGYGKITDSYMKRFNLVNIISHDKKSQNVKVEISQRQFGSRYEMKTLLGISMLVMVQEDMFAHKLMAMLERVGKTSRDIFDVHFFAKNNWPINREIVEARSGMSFKETLAKCIEELEKVDARHILDGLGELLTDAQKDWARAKLKSDTIFLLQMLYADAR
jgi:predicted nucleotidyltransferase component of viral defense system